MMRLMAVVAILCALQQEKPPKSYRLPSTDLKQRVIWGSQLEVPDGPSLAFGGQDQRGDDGNPHTRLKIDGEWRPVDFPENPLSGALKAVRDLAGLQKQILSRERGLYLESQPASGPESEIGAAIDRTEGILNALHPEDWYAGQQLKRALVVLDVLKPRQSAREEPRARILAAHLARQIELEKIADELDIEPPPRALSPIVWDPKTKVFVIFGGDHLDYLTNDLWVFDPAQKRWFQRHPADAPAPRANHHLKAVDGKLVVSGGYTYTSSTDYVGGQYRDHNDEEWVYDLDKSRGQPNAFVSRVYRTGRLHPEHYLGGPVPAKVSWAGIPANTWTMTKPPQLPALNRDWGTAVLDPDRDLILRWSGGHSAHGGSDVLQYHISSNRWELTMPVEFPLGQLYSNTEYPDGWNFNHRPWITGHTYQSYGYDPNLKKMLFTGRKEHCYVWDSDAGDWKGRFAKPKDMVYGDCYYTLTITSTPKGLICWTQQGMLFRFEKTDWTEIPLKGKLPGSVVDNSTVMYDSKRDRLLFARKSYGDKTEFDGVLQTVDLKTGEVGALAPEGKEKAGGVSYLCQLRYDSTNDLVLAGCTLPEVDGFRRTPAYDCAGNRWISLKIGGDDPSGKKGRNVSLGLMYDAKRQLFWAVDTNSQVFVLRLDPATADPHPL